jgi:hypothetical protein
VSQRKWPVGGQRLEHVGDMGTRLEWLEDDGAHREWLSTAAQLGEEEMVVGVGTTGCWRWLGGVEVRSNDVVLEEMAAGLGSGRSGLMMVKRSATW